MIIDFSTTVKDYEKKILQNERLLEEKNYICPKCGAKHSLAIHSTYSRNFIYERECQVEETKIDIQRLKCKSCNSTHAILPDDTIPYRVYSSSFVLLILNLRFCEGRSVLEIAEKCGVAFEVIYGFIRLFYIFMNVICLTLRLISNSKVIQITDYKGAVEAMYKTVNSGRNFLSLFAIHNKRILFENAIQKRNKLADRIHINFYND